MNVTSFVLFTLHFLRTLNRKNLRIFSSVYKTYRLFDRQHLLRYGLTMTVERSTFEHNKHVHEELRQTYATVSEVTCVSDHRLVDEAIDACRADDGSYKVENVVSMLLQEDSVRSCQAKTNANAQSVSFRDGPTQRQTRSQTIKDAAMQPQSSSPSDSGAIKAGELDLKTAISASLQDTQCILGGQVTREEQDISRVLEVSLAESKVGTKRKRGEIWFEDVLNPHERRRKDTWPVGLKNLGNTCWFNSVIQRRRNLHFLSELRLLFAKLIGSSRQYVDPSSVLEVLREAFFSASGAADNQQDVSEFQHKLLEWLEDAFKWSIPAGSTSDAAGTETSGGSACSPRPSLPTSNPVTEIFYGQFRAEGEREGEKFEQMETFGQFPLQVTSARNIHESLEATTSQGEIETVNTDPSGVLRSGQELWFTHLPPVLTFELSRFQFNHQLKRPEKIHDKVEFPDVMFLDRYLDDNKSETRLRRKRARHLREQLTSVQTRLDRFMNYGSAGKRCPLHHVLQHTLEFAGSGRRRHHSGGTEGCPHCSHVDVLSNASDRSTPCAVTSCSQFKSVPGVSEVSPVPEDSSVPEGDRTELSTSSPSSQCHGRSPEPTSDASRGPMPGQVSDEELSMLQMCLRRWREEVESDVRDLQSRISSLEGELDQLYSDDSMKKFPYHLHAVLVHEGQAGSGHYWAFIYDRYRGLWFKFNDITVSQSSWEEVQREGVGGHHTASAYCLVYISLDGGGIRDDPEDRTGLSPLSSSSTSSSTSQPPTPPVSLSGRPTDHLLPGDLRELVAADNAEFQEELENWDIGQMERAAGGCASSVATAPAALSLNVEHPVAFAVTVSPSADPRLPCVAQPELVTVHAALCTDDTRAAVKLVDDYLDIGQCDVAVNKAVTSEVERISSLADDVRSRMTGHCDRRLGDVAVYMACNHAPMDVLRLAIMERFACTAALDEKTTTFRRVCFDKVKVMKEGCLSEASTTVGKLDDYESWHSRYHSYRQAAHMLVLGLQAYSGRRYSDALHCFHQAWLHNCHAMDRTSVHAGVDKRLISFFLRTSLEHVSEQAMCRFETDTDPEDALAAMSCRILPAFSVLATSDFAADSAALDGLRSRWCGLLEMNLSDDKADKLRDFLTKIFGNLSDKGLDGALMPVCADEMVELSLNYCKMMGHAQESGDIQKALL